MCCMGGLGGRISKVVIERIGTAVLSKGIFFFLNVDFSLKSGFSDFGSDTGMELVASGLEKVTTLTKFRA